MEFENATADSFQPTQSTQEPTRPPYLRPTEYLHLFDAVNDHREMFKPIIKGRQCRELKRDVHEKEGNARKDAAELAEAQEPVASKSATVYGTLFDSRKLTLTKSRGIEAQG